MICLNGKCYKKGSVPTEEWLFSEGIQFGLGLFETMRLVHGQIEDFSKHLDRMRDSSSELNIAFPEVFREPETLLTLLAPMIEAVEHPLSVLKLTVIKTGETSSWWAQTRAFPYSKTQLETGLKLALSSVRRNSTSVLQRHKSLNYAENWLEKKKSVENGYQEVIFLNEDSFVAEGSSTNIFFLKDGIWHTPAVEIGLLNGIMRQRVMNMMLDDGAVLIEGYFTYQQLLSADAVVVTNALMGVLPVRQIGQTEFMLSKVFQSIDLEKIDPVRSLFIE